MEKATYGCPTKITRNHLISQTILITRHFIITHHTEQSTSRQGKSKHTTQLRNSRKHPCHKPLVVTLGLRRSRYRGLLIITIIPIPRTTIGGRAG